MHTLAFYLHDLRPSIFELGPIKPRWYGFAYLMGFLVAYLLLRLLSRRGMLRLHPDRVPDLVLNSCIFGVLIGGRLGYVLFYNLPNALKAGETPMLWEFSSSFPFWGVLRVWEGGMSAHGGILFTILALAYFVWSYNRSRPRAHSPGYSVADLLSGRLTPDLNIGSAVSKDAPKSSQPSPSNTPPAVHKLSLVNIGDAACMVVAVGLCFGRVANFINGELYGHPTTVPWAVQFPSEIWAPTNGVYDLTQTDMAKIQYTADAYLIQHAQDLTRADIEAFLSSHKQLRDEISARVGGLDLSDPAHLQTAVRLIVETVQADPAILTPADYAKWWDSADPGLRAALRKAFAQVLPPRHPSQLYEALLEGLALFTICWCVGWFWRKDGMAGGAFLTFYPIMRIIGEQFRVGDTPAHLFGHEVSKGILYSIPLVLVGLAYWAYWNKKDRRTPWIPFENTVQAPATQPEPAASPAKPQS